MMKKAYSILLILCLLIGQSSCDQKETISKGSDGMVVTAHFLASEVGADILKQGGNAFDAAVAVQFALAVVYPRAGNIAGGGFAVIRTADGKYNTLDFREKAPLAAYENMYVDSSGNALTNLGQKGHLAVGVPGSVDGMCELHKKYGSIQWEKLLQPAIDFAGNGIKLTELEANKLNDYRERILTQNSGKKEIRYVKDTLFLKGDILLQPELKETLKRIQLDEREGFYGGKTAELLISEIQNGNGIITNEDLKNYKAVWREALVGKYRDCKIISMPPPSSGGIALIQLLKGAEKFELRNYGFASMEHFHIMTELERRVYADRATWLGDPDFYDVPTSRLISDVYLDERFSDISIDKKSDSQEIKAGEVNVIESFETTHFSIADKAGNAIAITTTLNGNYGCKVVVDGAGFLLNNEMDDFSIKPGVPNQFGLVGGMANAIQPEKRMLSSMTPTIVEKDGELRMVLGTPGGSTIITSVFQNIINAMEFEMTPQECVNAPRIHSQWLPDEIYIEPNAIDNVTRERLEKMGHVIIDMSKIGMMANIFVQENGDVIGCADTIRHKDSKAIGY
ncbi:gamma-glutamyltransferase [Marinifilum sp. N1E240]|uniref:gamma-glutamyltransferase n=1 Tax=Marinifilum sp. N1E240 TaxID=2608082 RepID=UPI00128E3DFA|nr:gamma-glutamyltransferase [Marinifilum sp. N1E240]MPQ46498.1 gamma-glutamyltransferase [Marinifilum sp. N1E240]